MSVSFKLFFQNYLFSHMLLCYQIYNARVLWIIKAEIAQHSYLIVEVFPSVLSNKGVFLMILFHYSCSRIQHSFTYMKIMWRIYFGVYPSLVIGSPRQVAHICGIFYFAVACRNS